MIKLTLIYNRQKLYISLFKLQKILKLSSPTYKSRLKMLSLDLNILDKINIIIYFFQKSSLRF